MRNAVAPLVPLVAAMAAGIVIDRFVEPCETEAWIRLALAFATIAAFTIRRSWIFAVAFLAGLAAIGGGWHHFRWSDLAADDLARTVTETPEPAWVRGLVRETLGLRRNEGLGSRTGETANVTSRFVLDLTESSDGTQWQRASGRAMVIVAGDLSEIQAGQRVEAAGHLARIASPLNPGEFDYRAFLRAQGIRLRLTVDEPASLWRDQRGTGMALGSLLGSIRAWSRAQLIDRFDPAIAPLATALLLGQREGIEPEINDAFARTGTTHLLAISGLQLQALAVALLLLFRVAGVRRRPAYLVVGLAMVGYALLVGLAPSVVRSTVMTATFCLAAIAHRLDRPANTLALAALGTLAVNPMFLFDVGCQLSFLAIGSLVWLVPAACARVHHFRATLGSWLFGPRSPLDELERQLEPRWRTALRRAGNGVVDGAVASTVVWLAALPLVALRFHLVSPIGILLNIPLIPLTSAALLLGGLGLGLAVVWGPLGAPLAWATGCLLKLTQAIVLWGVAQPWGHRFVVGPAWAWVVIFYVLVGVATVVAAIPARRMKSPEAAWFRRSIAWWLLAAWVVPGWLLADIAMPAPTLEAEFLAVGHGLAVLIQTPDGRTLLYDCGRLRDPTVGRRLLAPALWARGVSRIETIFLSHADQDHYDGLTDLLDRFPIGAVRVPLGFATQANPLAQQLIAQIRSRGVPIQPITAPQSWETDGVGFRVLHPTAGWHPETSDNARSLVLDIAYAGRHLLLTGDLEQQGLVELVARPHPDPPPEVFLSPHHGGRTANPEWLYEWARPRLVVVSQRPIAGRAGDALSLIERQGIPVLRTWRKGSIRLRWTSQGVTARAFLDERIDHVEKRGLFEKTEAASRPAAAWSFIDTQSPPARSRKVLQLAAGLLGFAAGVFACLVLAVVEFGAWALVLPPRSTIKEVDDPGSDPVTGEPGALVEQIVVRASDGALLAGRWFPAPGPTASGRTVLLLHGFAESSTRLETRRAAILNRHGWSVASLDSRGYGRSQGPYATFGGREARDIAVWLDALAERTARIGPALPFQPALWGRSMGAAIALRAAASDHRPVALVLESPMVDLHASLAFVLRQRFLPFPRLLAGLVIRRAGKIAGIPLDRPRAIESGARVACSTAIIHGTDDPLVAAAEARRLADAFRSPARTFDVPGAKHTDVVDVGGDDLLDRIAEFLDEAADTPAPIDRETPGEM